MISEDNHFELIEEPGWKKATMEIKAAADALLAVMEKYAMSHGAMDTEPCEVASEYIRWGGGEELLRRIAKERWVDPRPMPSMSRGRDQGRVARPRRTAQQPRRPRFSVRGAAGQTTLRRTI
jgi:hypothetical protein